MHTVLWDPRGRAVPGPVLVDGGPPGREQAFVLLAQEEMGPCVLDHCQVDLTSPVPPGIGFGPGWLLAQGSGLRAQAGKREWRSDFPVECWAQRFSSKVHQCYPSGCEVSDPTTGGQVFPLLSRLWTR